MLMCHANGPVVCLQKEDESAKNELYEHVQRILEEADKKKRGEGKIKQETTVEPRHSDQAAEHQSTLFHVSTYRGKLTWLI